MIRVLLKKLKSDEFQVKRKMGDYCNLIYFIEVTFVISQSTSFQHKKIQFFEAFCLRKGEEVNLGEEERFGLRSKQ